MRTCPPAARFSAVTFRGQLQIRVDTAADTWQLDFTAPPGQLLIPGEYPNAERVVGATGHAPGVDVRGNSSVCGEVYGSFALDQLEADADGNVTTLDMSFVQRCSQGAPALKGNIYFAARPLSFRYTSEPSDPIGAGASQTFTGSDSVFAVSPGVDNISVGVSGHRQIWSLELVAPIGGTLAPGTYRTATLATATTAKLDVFPAGVGCNTSTGSITIREVRLNGDGGVSALDASFGQRCTGVGGVPGPAGAPRGVIRISAGSFPPAPTPTP